MTLHMDHILTVILVLLCSSGLQAEEIHNEHDLFRLVGGSSRCSGTLEVKHDGDWRPVYNPVWKAVEVAQICRKLDCGSVVTVADKEAPSHTASARQIDSLCVIFGVHLSYCVKPDISTKRLEISCHDSVRLVNGTMCSGRLEVKSNQQWSSVCEDDFDQQDAEVVCRELGCGAPSVLQGALYGEVEAPLWTKEFQCGGNESALLDCRSSDSARNTCSPGKAVGLTCSEPVRLVGGSSRCNGRLEIKHLKEWRPVFEIHWSLKEAALVCRTLDCGSAVSVEWRNTSSDGPTWRIGAHCIKFGSTLMDCVNPATSSYNLEITCSDFVRLGNENHCSGRLEVKSNQQWSSVCEDDFDQQDAEVVCRELGCGAPSVLQGALYGEVKPPMWTKEFQCGGNESALLDCRSSDSDRNTCSPGKAVGLTCSAPVRLVGGSSRCNGRLEMKQGEWRPVFDSDSDWTLKEATVMCRNLDCGSVVSIEWTKESPVRPAWAMTPKCVHSGSDLRDCVKQHSSHSIMEITCSDSVRLVNGTSLCSGRLEVKSNQQWSPVCEDDFDQRDAEEVCSELGCGAPLDFQGALYGEAEPPVWTKEFQCGGNESALLNCRSSGSARNTCSPGKAVGLTCSAPVRLVGGSSHCSGILEMKHDREWRPVFHRWTKEEPAVLCRELDCGSFVFKEWKVPNSSIPIWKMSSNCVHPASTLRDCVKSGFFKATTELICSEPVRLGGEHIHCNGTVEVKHGDWRPASASDWTLEDAAVFCKTLDCGSAVSTGWKKESSLRSVWALTPECVRSGSAVRDCVRPDSDSSILEIACSGRSYRLVEGSSRCSGILEVKHEEEWRPVSSYDSHDEDAAVFCRKLHCGTDASTDWRRYDSFKSTWEISFKCVRSGSPLKECIKPHSTSFIMEITCSDEE